MIRPYHRLPFFRSESFGVWISCPKAAFSPFKERTEPSRKTDRSIVLFREFDQLLVEVILPSHDDVSKMVVDVRIKAFDIEYFIIVLKLAEDPQRDHGSRAF